MDPDVWGDPEAFRPERFLDGNGQLANTENMYNIFGAGKVIYFLKLHISRKSLKSRIFLFLP